MMSTARKRSSARDSNSIGVSSGGTGVSPLSIHPIETYSRSTSPDDGTITTDFVTPSPKDARPSWPSHPFNEESESFAYNNSGSTRQPGFPESFNRDFGPHPDSRPRYSPFHQEIAAFYRWDIEFNPYGPDWSYWLTHLVQFNHLTKQQCEPLHIRDIVKFLDTTTKPDELSCAADSFDLLGDRMAAVESMERQGATDKASKNNLDHIVRRATRDILSKIGGLLLKTHGLPRRLHEIGRVYPGPISRDKFFNFLERVLRFDVADDSGPRQSDLLRRLAAFVKETTGRPVPRLILYPQDNRAQLDAIPFNLEPKQAAVLRRLIEKNGEPLTAPEFGTDLHRIIRGRTDHSKSTGMPKAIQEVIESNTRGARLTVPAKISGA